MRIISKYSDSYDFGMSYGQDRSIVYHRKENSFLFDDFTVFNKLKKEQSRYYYAQIEYNSVGKKFYKRVYIDVYYFAIGGFLYHLYAIPTNFKQCNKFKDKYKFYLNPEDIDLRDEKSNPIEIKKSDFGRDIHYTEQGSDVLYKEFINFGSPIIAFGFKQSQKWCGADNIINHNDVEFAKNYFLVDFPLFVNLGITDLFDQNKVFMDISQFLSYNNEKPMVQIDNKDKIIKAGFDTKISFRGKK